jgi:hypothetical protein
MSAQSILPPLLPRQLLRFLSRLKVKLKQSHLLRVLEALPAATTIDFYESNLLDRKAVRTFVGYRTQDDGSMARTWAYVLLNHDVAEPAIVFRDEVSQGDNEFVQKDNLIVSHRRSATSLLRRAGKLLPPFRFLQFDSNKETHNVRSMICALILYYALATGITDSATKWAKFESSLLEALRHIESNADYQDWRAEQHEPTKISEATGLRLDTAPDDTDSRIEAQNDVINAPMRGGVVRSIGRSMVATPGTGFAQFKDALGTQVHLLDAIPFTPITIERQNSFPEYFSFRLHLGTYRDANVYVYLAPDLRPNLRILAEPGDDNVVPEWTLNDLSDTELQLIKPFDFFMSLHRQDLTARGLRVRYFVYYYFMLAENEGLIDDLELRITAKTILPRFISACKELQAVVFGVDDTDSAEDTADEGQMMEQPEAVPGNDA